VSLTSKTGVRIVNDFVHDVAFGLWPGTVLAIWTVRGLTGSAPGTAVQLHAQVLSASWVLGVSLVALVVTGTARLNYYELNLRSGTLPAKHRMVVIKHVAFTALLVACTVWFWYLLPPVA
jgi:hypothetical protein